MWITKAVSVSLLATGLGTHAAWAAAPEHRLAFSKAENIELFVEGATADNWCTNTLKVRAVHGGAFDPQALNRLLPKLGGLFAQQCPQAQQVDWRSVDATGQVLAQGSSRAADGWAVAKTLAATASSPSATASAAPPTPPAAQTSAPAIAATTVSAATSPQPSPNANSGTGQASPAAPLGTPAQATTPGETAAVPTAETNAQTTPPAAPPVAIQSETAAAVVAPAQAVAGDTAAVPPTSATPPATRQKGLMDFAVANWQPPAPAQRAELTTFLTTLKDQNGCQLVSDFELGTDAAYLKLITEEVACDAQGFAQGKGRLRLERSDGARLLRTSEIWFSDGLMFDEVVQGVRREDIVAVHDNNQTIWLGLGSDVPSNSHYLLRARLGQYQGGIGVWQVQPQLDVLTANTEAFREVTQIRAAIDRALAVLQEAMPETRSARLVFTDNAEAGLREGDRRHLLYLINASRGYNYRTGKAQGPWGYNLQHATNFLFEREAILAREKRAEEERQEQQRLRELAQQARVERENLQHFEELKTAMQGSDAQMQSQLERDIGYSPDAYWPGRDAYSRLVRGGSDTVMRIVHVDDHDDDNAVVDLPYPMQLLGQKDLREGWYWINGTRKLDPELLDDQNLPMSIVDVSAGAVHPCEEEGCKDLLDPLAIMRLQLGNPNWTPEAAKQLIESAPQGLFW